MQTNPTASPIPCACPHCGGAAELQPTIGDREDFACPRCGEFSISGTDAALVDRGVRGSSTAKDYVLFEGRRPLLTWG
jgi:tRNA(Ile2) C34 agmatinyltransferase TiaS